MDTNYQVPRVHFFNLCAILGCVPLGRPEKGSLIQDHLDHSASKDPNSVPLMKHDPSDLGAFPIVDLSVPLMYRDPSDLGFFFGSSQRNAP